MDTLTYTTPARTRDPQPIPVTWCGEDLTITRPKDAVLYFATTVTASDIDEADRALAMIQFLDGTLTPEQRKRFFERVLDRDDPINARTTIALVRGLTERWAKWPESGDVEPLIVEPQPSLTLGKDVRIRNDDLDLKVTAHPPKDIVLFYVGASIATTATQGHQAWAIGMFLDACLDPLDSYTISRRLRDRDDDLDLQHISEIVSDLIERWTPKTNRAQRRAAARER